MQRKLSSRVVLEHGQISNILAALGLVDQIALSKICSRTHFVTVPWNTARVLLPQDEPNVFPKIDDISDQFVCGKVEANIEGADGNFYGSICKATNLPDGYGVFTAGDWINCGKAKNGDFTDGRRVCVNNKAVVLKLAN